MEKINVRNIYIELLNKIKNVQGVDKDYVDGLIELVDDEITSLDSDINAITSVIPETASVSNQLATADDIPDVTQIELDLQTLTASVSAIDLLIPSGASSSNQLATADDIPAAYAGSSTAGGAANSVKGTLTVDDADYNTYTYNGSHNINLHFRALHCEIPSTGWSNTTDADGYYTNQIITDTINAYNTPLVSCCGEFRDTVPTSAQKAAFNLCDVFVFQDSTQSNRMTAKAKVKPTTTFYVCIHGVAVATS